MLVVRLAVLEEGFGKGMGGHSRYLICLHKIRRVGGS
jgi:hypothetical protein